MKSTAICHSGSAVSAPQSADAFCGVCGGPATVIMASCPMLIEAFYKLPCVHVCVPHVHVYTCVQLCVHVCDCVHNAYMYLCASSCVHMRVVCAHMCTCVPYVSVCMCVTACGCVPVLACVYAHPTCMCTYMCAGLHVCAYVCVCAHTEEPEMPAFPTSSSSCTCRPLRMSYC